MACAAAFAAILGGCAGGNDRFGDFYSEPGKFRFLDCATIAQRSASISKQEQELASLMDRANQDVGGPLVSALVYSTERNTYQSELAQLRREAAEKRCGDGPPPARSTPPPASRRR